MWAWVAAGLGVAAALYAILVARLLILGRREDARALAGFLPDCLVLLRRLVADPRVPRSRRALVIGLAVYLAFPLDLVPDFLPVVGHLDDVLLVGLVLRSVARAAGPGLLEEHWPGPASSLDALRRLL